MKTTLGINNIEGAESKAGKAYFKVATDQGPMSCFEKNVADVLANYVGRSVTCEVATSADGKFKNIRSVDEDTPPVKMNAQPETEIPQQDKFVEARASKDASMYTSYTKDLIVAGWELNEAIKAIKFIKKQF